MYDPYVVTHHPHISSLGCLHIPPSRLPSSIFLNLILPDVLSRSSSRMSEQNSIGMNHHITLLKNKSINYGKRREEVADLEYQSSHDSLIQSELGGVIAPKSQYQPSRSSSHNTGGCGIFLSSSVSSFPVD